MRSITAEKRETTWSYRTADAFIFRKDCTVSIDILVRTGQVMYEGLRRREQDFYQCLLLCSYAVLAYNYVCNQRTITMSLLLVV